MTQTTEKTFVYDERDDAWSSFIKAAYWRPLTQTRPNVRRGDLLVEFKSGARRLYEDLPYLVWVEYTEEDESRGAYYNEVVKRDRVGRDYDGPIVDANESPDTAEADTATDTPTLKRGDRVRVVDARRLSANFGATATITSDSLPYVYDPSREAVAVVWDDTPERNRQYDGIYLVDTFERVEPEVVPTETVLGLEAPLRAAERPAKGVTLSFTSNLGENEFVSKADNALDALEEFATTMRSLSNLDVTEVRVVGS